MIVSKSISNFVISKFIWALGKRNQRYGLPHWMVMKVTETTFCSFELFATSLHLFKHIFTNVDKKTKPALKPSSTKQISVSEQTVFQVL